SDGPHPAIVLVTGAASTTTGVRDGTASRALISFAHTMVLDGYAVLRYDPPGVGQSTGDAGIEIMDERAAEAMAALWHLQTRADIVSEQIGLWGVSQGSWVISLAAAEHPEDVAFLLSVSGAGLSVADQQVWGIEAQTRAAGLEDEAVVAAGLMGRLLIDWQLTDPIYAEAAQASVDTLGPGPWSEFADIVYSASDSGPADTLDQVIVILESVQDEPWADALYLTELYLPRLRSATPEQIAALGESVSASLLTDPKDFMTKVRSPVLAFFGENDIVQPSETSAALFDKYLTAAGNTDFTIVMLPGVGHGIAWNTPGYSEEVSAWLKRLAGG
ncbi:MAG: hypothetical protein HKN80_09380, partial [Acidimicrobiia bacterium]|nr:hypothetical protein [Acidimicrobiia bacterium]